MNNNYQVREIKRTICIGLGGTGRDVLMRIRRLVVDRYGSLDRLPLVRFVHIDTDRASTQATSLSTGNSYNGQSLSFKPTETVGATMTTPEVDNFVRGLKRSLDLESRGPYENIRQWFPYGLLNDLKAVEEGAKGIRPVGRLAFFHNYRKIQEAISRAEQLTRTAPPSLIKEGLRTEPGLNIFVVGSLCGGTGSGMFLDVAYSLRQAYGDQEGAQIVGYFVVSPKLYGDNSSMRANTYAALKELDHFSTPSTQFKALYDTQNLTWVDEKRPPFDYTYLVSNQTQGEYVINKQSKLCNVIAHKISLEFSGELSVAVRGMRDNFLQHMRAFDNHPRRNVQRYLTFGLSAIYFPRDAIAQIALTQVSRRLLTYWLDGMGQSPDPLKLLKDFILQKNWREDFSRKDNFVNQLKDLSRDSNGTFSRSLNRWKSSIENKLSDCKDADTRRAVVAQIPRDLRTRFREVQYSRNERDRGIWLTRIEQAGLSLSDQLKKDVIDYLTKILTPGDPEFSIRNARDWLEGLQSDLQGNQRVLQETIQDLDSFKSLEDVEKRWRNAEQAIEDVENKRMIPVWNRRNSLFAAEVKESFDQIRSFVAHNFELAIAREALQLTIILQKFVQEQSVQFAGFDRITDNARAEYERRIEDLKQLNPDDMSGEPIFDESVIEIYHQQLVPESRASNELASLSLEVMNRLNRKDSLIDFLLQERPTQEQLVDEIFLSIEWLFGSRVSEVESVIRQFIKEYGSHEREYRLNQILEEARPLLRLNLADPYFDRDSGKSSRLIGFQDIDEPETRQFRSLLTQSIGVPESDIKPIQAKDEILFVTEYGGFPLRLIRGLEQMGLTYLREKARGHFLHLYPQELFTDIIPPDADLLSRLEDVFYPCLAFNIIQQESEPDRLEFQFQTDDFRETTEIFSFSPLWNKAIEELSQHSQITEILQRNLEEVISAIRANPDLYDREYLPLLIDFEKKVDDFTPNDPNFLCRVVVVGSKTDVSDMNYREGVISRFARRLQTQLSRGLLGGG